MQRGIPNPNDHSRDAHLEWFTHDILPGGKQICAIRPLTDLSAERTVLDESASQLMQALLSEIAVNEAIPFGPTKQAVLRAFLRIAPQRSNTR